MRQHTPRTDQAKTTQDLWTPIAALQWTRSSARTMASASRCAQPTGVARFHHHTEQRPVPLARDQHATREPSCRASQQTVGSSSPARPRRTLSSTCCQQRANVRPLRTQACSTAAHSPNRRRWCAVQGQQRLPPSCQWFLQPVPARTGRPPGAHNCITPFGQQCHFHRHVGHQRADHARYMLSSRPRRSMVSRSGGQQLVASCNRPVASTICKRSASPSSATPYRRIGVARHAPARWMVAPNFVD